MSQNRRIYTEKELENNTMKLSQDEIDEIRERQNELQSFEIITEDDIPYYLSDYAKDEFRRILPYLQQLHTGKLDSQIVAQYCTLSASCKKLIEDININGEIINGKINPALKTYQSLMKELRATASMLGLNPSARAKLIADMRKAKVDEIEKEAESDYFAERFTN